jgi:hypothetical protein
MGLLTRSLFVVSCAGLVSLSSARIPWTYSWSGYGGNAQHTALSPAGINTGSAVLWSFPIDTNPQYSGNELLTHYGEPCVTPMQNLVVSQRQNNGSFKVVGLNPLTPLHPFVPPYYTWSITWSAASSYTFPPHNWTPSFGPTLLTGTTSVGGSGSGGIQSLATLVNSTITSPQVAWPESGGRIALRSNCDSAGGTIVYHAFYGDSNYAMSSASFDASIQICTPITPGPDGTLYFGYYSTGNNPLGLKSGIGFIHPNGVGGYTTAATLSNNDVSIDRVAFNAAPTITTDNKRLYVVVSAGYSGKGYLVQVNPANMLTRSRIALKDPKNHLNADVTCDSTASPMIAPDGSVFYGTLENVGGSNDYRGWMLHYDANLLTTYPPGAFGWDDTASIVPASLLGTNYLGGSPFLICTKYNNYYEGGGDGVNQVAILDPYNTTTFNGVTVMNVVTAVAGVTPDPAGIAAGDLNAVKEWCINSAAVDSFDKYIILNSEDGNCYVWDPNATITGGTSFPYSYPLTAGIGEAYTPTIIGYSQMFFAISNAQLYFMTPY